MHFLFVVKARLKGGFALEVISLLPPSDLFMLVQKLFIYLSQENAPLHNYEGLNNH